MNIQMKIQKSDKSIYDPFDGIVDTTFQWNSENYGLMELKSNVENLLGFNTFQYRDNYLTRRFNSRMRAYKIDNYFDYWTVLKDDEREQDKLVNALTINVTEFFRDNPVYETFRTDVIPNILARKQGKIRVWSAGCSDGKEAYSIAMIFIDALGEQKARDRVEIISTDIDKDCLHQASSGLYISKPNIYQADIKQQLKFINNSERYFDITNDIYSIKSCVKDIVKFQYHDLISSKKKENFDVIFCRNVVIYFTKEFKNLLYENFHNALNSEGYLIMGKTEILLGESRKLFKSFNPEERIFIKK